MLSILYVSTAAQALDDGDLAELVQSSRVLNARRGVTGVLFHDQGRFMQVIEGPKIVVHHLFEAIRRDPRHAGVTTLEERLIETREFHGWAMAFNDLGNPGAPGAGWPYAFLDFAGGQPLPLGGGQAGERLAGFARAAARMPGSA